MTPPASTARSRAPRDVRPTAPGGSRVVPGADRVVAIRDAALELFATKGYRATTMADIGERVGVRGPSLYRHVSSKHQLLVEIMLGTMERLLENHRTAVASTDDLREQLRRAAEAHARYHARHRYEAFVGTREIGSLDEPSRAHVLERRAAYEQAFRRLIEGGRDAGVFGVSSPRLASYAILDMGMGVSVWYRPDGPMSEDELAYAHGDFALRLVAAAP